MEVCRGIISLRAARTTHAGFSAASAEPPHQFLPQKHSGNTKGVRETGTYLRCRRDPSSRAPAGSAGRQPCLALASRDLCGSAAAAAPYGTRALLSIAETQLSSGHRRPNIPPPSPGASLPEDSPVTVITHLTVITHRHHQRHLAYFRVITAEGWVTSPTPTRSSLAPGRFPFPAVTPGRPGSRMAAGCSAASQRDALLLHPSSGGPGPCRRSFK